jgi:hypothetical protein
MPKPAATAAAIVALAIACGKPEQRPEPRPAPDPASAAATKAAPSEPATAGRPSHRKHEDRHDPALADAPPLQLTVAVNGATSAWRQDAFDRVARYTTNDKASDGEAREVWSLRELVRTLVGPTARVTAVAGDGGTKSLDRAAWDDASHTPLLHTTRRGTLKFRWADARGTWGEPEVKDVVRIEIVR